jgi:hypothetical protein
LKQKTKQLSPELKDIAFEEMVEPRGQNVHWFLKESKNIYNGDTEAQKKIGSSGDRAIGSSGAKLLAAVPPFSLRIVFP